MVDYLALAVAVVVGILIVSTPRIGVLATLAFYPLVLLVPRGQTAGLNVETILFAVGIVVMLIRARRPFPPSRMLIPILVYYGLMVLGLVTLFTWYDPNRGIDPLLRILRAFKMVLWPTLMFFLVYAWVRSERDRDLLKLALGAGVLFAAISGVGELVTGGFMSGAFVDRIEGFTHNPNVLGILIASFSPVTLDGTFDRSSPRWKRVLFGLTHALALVVLVLTQSRKAWIAALLAHFVWLLFTNRRLVLPALGAAAIALTVAYPLLPEVIRERIEDTFKPGQVVYRTGGPALDASSSARLVFYTVGFEMFVDSPVIGHGFRGFRLKTIEYGAKYGILRPWDPHSLPLKVLSENGIVGVVGFVWVVGLVLLSGYRMTLMRPPDRRTGVVFLSSCAALGFANLLGTAMDASIIAVPFWAFFGGVARCVVEAQRATRTELAPVALASPAT
jgi:O-antigen ligase